MMKKFLFPIALAALSAGAQDVREIEIKTEKVGDAVHWMPEKVEVKPGEKIRFNVKHELEGGFDFHGFSIAELGITKQVNRNKPLQIETTVPTDLAAGEYKISCQFHPKHVAAAMTVAKAEAKPAEEAAKPAAPAKKKK